MKQMKKKLKLHPKSSIVAINFESFSKNFEEAESYQRYEDAESYQWYEEAESYSAVLA